MPDLLIITKRNNHGKYFKKLAHYSRLEVKLHYISLLSAFNPFCSIRHINVNKADICRRQLSRKLKAFPKLLSYRIIQRLYYAFLYISVCLNIAQFAFLFSEKKPKRVALWNGDKMPYHTVTEVAKAFGIPVVYFENGLLPNTTTVDFKGVNAKNSLPRSSEFYRLFSQVTKRPEKMDLYQRPMHKKRKSDSTIDLPKNYIFIPLQVPNDSQIIVNSPWVHSMEQLYSTVLAARKASAFHDYPLVFKAHPSWPDDFKHLADSTNNVLFANNNTTQELIEKSKAVITINSTVGIESLLLGKTVVTLGDACYNIEHLVLHANCVDRFNNIFKQLLSWEPDEAVRQGFISYLKYVYCLPERWSIAEQTHFKALDKRLCGEDEYSRYFEYHTPHNRCALSLNLKNSVNI